MTVLIFGAGYSGREIGKAFVSAGREVFGTTRSADNGKRLRTLSIAPLVFDGTAVEGELDAVMQSASVLVQSIAPGPEGDPLLRLLDGRLQERMPHLRFIAYLSTVGVYGDHDGAWVDEATVCRPVSQRSRERVEAEEGWRRLADRAGLPLSILRLSGIYGPGRNAFVNLESGKAKRLVKPDQVFNRIRVEDIAAATRFLAERRHDGIVNVTDNEPAPPQDVVTEAARLMGVAPPPEQDFATAELSPMARSFYGENKRVSNAHLQRMGYDFAFPDYRVSLAQLWAQKIWNQSG
ncbi:SDR family oxidoreductase [Rhizobium halophytocola]|uniref:Nucleoside-diphosphate-sugar epimerase n=1 Tax=Rhizobium halophytocola TaxID=735519 RepID=A0ABS4E0E7_9HYPH|nr:SDR family oxidoreductase [Rhizobium halophytocola]MBP1851412.1 nucleoside-diphosphate-sugar epimerase [Rhizobium halophytocola]